MVGFVYLLHLDAPLSPKHTARHYLGYTTHVPSRMQAHLTGRGRSLHAGCSRARHQLSNRRHLAGRSEL